MKYMSNRFGKSRIFGNARFKMPMNLQLFGYEDDGDGATAGSGSSDDPNTDGGTDDNTPTVEELLAQLAEERARSARLQNEKDTASSEAASFKKQLRAKMTANEQEEAAKAEAEAAKDAKIQELETKFRLMDYSKGFMGVGMDEALATEMAGLTGELVERDKFFSALEKFVKSIIKKSNEDYLEAFIKSNPSIKAGNGDGDDDDEAIEIARESAKRKQNNGFNEEALKQWM